MWNHIAFQAAGTLWFTSAQRCNQSHRDTSWPIPSKNQFTTHSWTAVLHVPYTTAL